MLLSLFWSGPAWATDYYVCDCQEESESDCVAGNDGNSGTDPESPWLSYEQARASWSSLSPGDGVRFCRGGVVHIGNDQRWSNTRCTAASPCVIGDYIPSWASQGANLPLLRQTYAGNGLAFEDGGEANHEEGVLVQNLELQCASAGCGVGVLLFNDIDDVTLEGLTIDGFGIGVYIGGSRDCSSTDASCDGRNDRIILRDSIITGNTSQGWLGGSEDSRIENNYFEGNGTEAVLDHNIYLSEPTEGTITGMQVTGNTLYRSTISALGACEGVSLVVHGNYQDLLIQGNRILEDIDAVGQGCWGIAVDNGYISDEAFTDVRIDGNWVENVGNIGIGLGSCQSCSVTNNVIIHAQDFVFTAISAPDRDLDEGDQELHDVDIRNNSILLTAGGGTGIQLGGTGTGHSVVSNALQSTAEAPFFCLALSLDASAYDTIDHNICVATQGGWEETVTTLSDWQALGWGASSRNVQPGFASIADYDLRSENESAPMVDAGSVTESATTDLEGHLRDSLPDVGAYEWGVPTDTGGTDTGQGDTGQEDTGQGDTGQGDTGQGDTDTSPAEEDGDTADTPEESDDCGCGTSGGSGTLNLLFLVPLILLRRGDPQALTR